MTAPAKAGLRATLIAVRSDRRLLVWALGILAASLALRLLFIHYAQWVPIADTRDYHDLARSLMEGRGYSQVYRGESPAYQGFTFRAYRMPGYPVALAAFYTAFGWHPHRAMFLNLGAELWTELMVFLLAFQLFGRRVALVAQGLWALQVLWTTALMSEPLFTAIWMTGLLMLVMRGSLSRWPGALAFGLLVAAGVFVRPVCVCCLLVAAGRLVAGPRGWRQVALLACMGLPLATGLGLWSYRNYRLFHAFVPLSTMFGRQNAPSFGIDHAQTYLTLRVQGRNEAEIDRALQQAILARIRANPVAAINIYGARLLHLFSLPPVDVVDRGLLWQPRFVGANTPGWVLPAFHAMYVPCFPVYACAGVGWLLLVLRRTRTDGLLATLATYLLIHGMVSDGNFRYAEPLYPVLCILAAVGMAAVAGRLARRVYSD